MCKYGYAWHTNTHKLCESKENINMESIWFHPPPEILLMLFNDLPPRSKSAYVLLRPEPNRYHVDSVYLSLTEHGQILMVDHWLTINFPYFPGEHGQDQGNMHRLSHTSGIMWAVFKIPQSFHYTGWLRTGFPVLRLLSSPTKGGC